MRAIAHADGHDLLWLVDELVAGFAAERDDPRALKRRPSSIKSSMALKNKVSFIQCQPDFMCPLAVGPNDKRADKQRIEQTVLDRAVTIICQDDDVIFAPGQPNLSGPVSN